MPRWRGKRFCRSGPVPRKPTHAHPPPGLWPLWRPSSFSQGFHVVSFPFACSAGTGPQPYPLQTPRNLQASALIWAEAMATSQGSEGTGPKEPHVTFRSFVSRSGSWPHPTPSDAEPRPRLPVPSCPGSHLLPLLSESGLGLSAWARRSCFGLLRSIQTSGPQPQCPWPSPAGLPHLARTCLCALLGCPLWGSPFVILPNIPRPRLHSATCCHSLSLLCLLECSASSRP